MEEIKQQMSNIPVPQIVIDRQGKVISANEYMGEVFIYEGIVGADVFTLTGLKAAELFECAESGRHPLVDRNEKTFNQSPIPNPQSPIPILFILYKKIKKKFL